MLGEEEFIVHCLRYEYHRGKNATEACASICSVLGKKTVSQNTCLACFKQFEGGNFNICISLKNENDELQALIDEDPCQTLNGLAEILEISQRSVSKRLKALGKIKKEIKWVPRELSQENKDDRVMKCLNLYNKLHRNSFLWKIVVCAEKWIYYDNPEKRQYLLNPNKAATVASESNILFKKVKLCIWYDMKGVLYYELLKLNETFNDDRYKQQLLQLNKEIDQKRPFTGKGLRPVKLLYENGKFHLTKSVNETLLSLGWDVLEQPAYSPDITPSDYHLFKSMQCDLSDIRFKTFKEIQIWIDDYIDSKDNTFFASGIRKLPERWRKVIDNNGKYFDD